jgi:hypothetical protein
LRENYECKIVKLLFYLFIFYFMKRMKEH